jgi:transposase
MSTDTLFDLPEPDPLDRPARPATAIPRCLTPDRRQLILCPQDLEDSIPEDHPVRPVWAYVAGLDLAEAYGAIRSVEGGAGHPATDPRLLLALWLFATLEGVGSARRLEALCDAHAAYRWLCGGVPVNYHTLADFRVKQEALLDRLLTVGAAALMAEGLAELNRVAQDGMRVRAAAGSSSFRRKPTLEQCLEEVQAQVSALRAELEADPGAGTRREQAARERAAREREERVKRALERAEELQAKQDKAKPNGKEPKPVRASTTDPEATVMKMADGGFRPALNVQFATTTAGGVIVGVDVTPRGTDDGEMTPMYAQLVERYGHGPKEYLVDGGFAQKTQIEALSAPELDCTVYAPVKASRNPESDPHAPKYGDGPGVVAWRARMATEEAQAIYKERAATAEWSNAQARNRDLEQFTVRGLTKARAVALLHALVHNLFTGIRLRRMAAQAA